MLAIPESISDMVRFDANAYLCVMDWKDKGPPPPRPKPRAMIIEGPFHKDVKKSPPPPPPTTLEFDNYPTGTPLPNDLEAVTKIAGHKGHFLLVEAGYYDGKFGRAIHVRLEKDSTRWRLSYVGAFEPRSKPEKKEPKESKQQSIKTEKWDEIEGVATIERNGTLMLVYATRGDPSNPATLNWVPLVVSGQSYEADRAQARHAKIADLSESLGNRGAGSLLLIDEAPGWRIRTVATYDPQHDFGPFRSAIYDAGLLEWDGVSLPKYTPPEKVIIRWTVDGLKVEALAKPPKSIAEAKIAIATDDEELGGVWRAVAERKETVVTKKQIREGKHQALMLNY